MAKIQSLNNFKQEVYRFVKSIPKGKVSTYGKIAAKLGKPRCARQVGWALHQNTDLNTPCHRVVDRNGRLAPNFAGPSRTEVLGDFRWDFDGAFEQRRRLLKEKTQFKDDMHVDLSKTLWTS